MWSCWFPNAEIVQLVLFSQLRLSTSPGLQRVLTSILVGILVGNVTHGSGSPAKTDRWGSGCRFCGGGYPPRVPAIYPLNFEIKSQVHKLKITINFDSQGWRVEYWDSLSQYSHVLFSTCFPMPQAHLKHPQCSTNALNSKPTLWTHLEHPHTSPSPRQGMWANLLQFLDWNSGRIGNQGRLGGWMVCFFILIIVFPVLSDNNVAGWDAAHQRMRTTWIRHQQHGFDNDDTDLTMTRIR